MFLTELFARELCITCQFVLCVLCPLGKRMLYHTLRCGLTPLFHSTETDFFHFAVALDVK